MEVCICNVNTGDCYKILSGHTDRILSVSWSPDGQTLASGSADFTIRLWKISGECDRIW